MEYKRTMYLLSLIHSAAEGTKREKIGELFKRAIISTSEYQHLKKLLYSTSFLDLSGKDKLKESEEALQKAITDIDNPTESIEHIDLLVQQIENELKRADDLLSSPSFFEGDLFAVKSDSLELYNRFYRSLANFICYYLISQFGAQAIRSLTFNHQAGFQSTMRLLNKQYGDELLMSYQNKKPLTWKISRASFAGNNSIPYEGYVIEYSEKPLSALLQQAQNGEYYRISPYVFAVASPSAQSAYMGIGNIVGVDAINGLSLLDSEIITSLPVDAFISGFEPSELLNALKKVLKSDAYCISPEDLVAALNRQRLSDTVEKRRSEGKCIFCGKPVSSVACKEHFSVAS